ncbi:TPA: hypothetical protein ACSTJ0_001204 [Serratia fonticola]
MSSILLNTSKIIATLLSLSLFIYIASGFLIVFTHDIGPLSAVLGGCASLITCIIAIRALVAARKWHTDKIKSEMFNSAQNTLIFIKNIPLTVLITNKELSLRLSILNEQCKSINEKEKSIKILLESKDFSIEYFKLHREMIKSLNESVRFNNYITTKYKEMSDSFIENFAAYIGLLTKPFEINNDGEIILNPELEKKQDKLTQPHGDIFNNLGKEKLSGFINLEKAANDAMGS